MKLLILVAVIVTLMANSAFKRNEFSCHCYSLLDDFSDGASADGTATFADCEAELLFHSDRRDEFDVDRDGVTRGHHFDAFRKLDRTGNVGRA